jgi:hypothetical protein
VTTLRRSHREFLSLLLLGGSPALASGTADAAHDVRPKKLAAGAGTESVPMAGLVR